jgi:hypothetical protein
MGKISGKLSQGIDWLSQRLWAAFLFLLAGGAALVAPIINLWSAFSGLDDSTKIWIIILFIVGILSFSFGLGVILRESFAKKYRSTFPWVIDKKGKNIEGIEYYKNRNDLAITLNNELENSKNVLALWHGGKQADSGLYEKRIFKRILWIKPELNLRAPLKLYIPKNWENITAEHFMVKVNECMKIAENNGTITGCIDFIPPYLILISDADSDDAWIRIEEFNLIKNYKERQSIRIYKKEQAYLFNILLEYYNKLWDKAE